VVLCTLIIQRKLKRLHCLEDDTHRLDSVAKDDLLERLSLIARVAALMDELHLLQDRRLPRLTSTYLRVSDIRRKYCAPHGRTQEKHLDLVALQHLVSLQLVLDLLIAELPLLLLGAHATTHLGRVLCEYWRWIEVAVWDD